MSPSTHPQIPASGPDRRIQTVRFLAALSLCLCLGLTGCLSESEDEPKILIGKSLPAIEGASSAAVMDGKLYVGNRADTALGIAVIDMANDSIIAFHKETLPPNQLAVAGDSVLVISESDYTDGALSRLNGNTGAFEASYMEVNSDNDLSADGDRVFLVERGKAEVTGFTGGTLTDANVFLNVNTGAETNPHQIALAGETAFITRYNSTHLLVAEADKKDGGTLDSIDLSEFIADSLKDSAGAVPRMDGAAVYGNRLFVTVQRLGTRYVSLETSKVVIIDIDTREVIGSIPLLTRNPIANSVRGKYLFVSCVGNYGVADGAVERIDMELAEHAGLVLEEADLKRLTDSTETATADLKGFLPVSDTKGYVLFSPDFVSSYIQPVDLP